MSGKRRSGTRQPPNAASPTLHSERYLRFLERLRAARTEAGLTQAEVADALRRPQSWVSKSERGERRVDVLELDDLSKLYAKPLRYFVP